MSSKIKTLFSQTGIYSLGSMSIKLISFLMLPIYLKFLSPADYGVLEIASIITNILIIILGFGMFSALFREYYREDDEAYRKKIAGTAFVFLLAVNIIIVLILLLSRKWISNLILGIPNQEYVFILIVANVFLLIFLNIVLSLFRAQEKPILYSLTNLIRTVFYVSINIYLVAYLKRGYVGALEGIFLSTAIILLLSCPILIKNITLKISVSALKRMLKFGLPLVVSGLSLWVLNLTDRFMLKFLLPEDIALTQVGIYSLAAKFSLVGKMLIVMPFSMSWGVAMFKHEKEEDARQFYANTFKYFILIASLFYVATVIFSQNIIHLLTDNIEYYEAYKAIPFLTGSAMFIGVFMLLSVGLTLTYKNKFSALATTIAAILNVTLNLILIPKYLITGAAIASIVSAFVMLALQYFFAQHVYRIKYNIVLFFFLLLLNSFIAYFCLVFHVSISVKIIFMISYVFVIYFLSGYKLKKVNLKKDINE